jgi:hypothetical protein
VNVTDLPGRTVELGEPLTPLALSKTCWAVVPFAVADSTVPRAARSLFDAFVMVTFILTNRAAPGPTVAALLLGWYVSGFETVTATPSGHVIFCPNAFVVDCPCPAESLPDPGAAGAAGTATLAGAASGAAEGVGEAGGELALSGFMRPMTAATIVAAAPMTATRTVTREDVEELGADVRPC